MRIFYIFLILLTSVSPLYAQSVEEGYAAFDAGRYHVARDIFMKLVEQGDVRAMNAMGVYSVNQGVKNPDRTVACDWYERAADKGYGPAQYNYANCFSKYGGRKTSIEYWHSWQLRASQSGYQPASETLLQFYLASKNQEKAIELAQEAAKMGYKVSKIALWILGKSNESVDDILCDFQNIEMLNIPKEYCLK